MWSNENIVKERRDMTLTESRRLVLMSMGIFWCHICALVCCGAWVPCIGAGQMVGFGGGHHSDKLCSGNFSPAWNKPVAASLWFHVVHHRAFYPDLHFYVMSYNVTSTVTSQKAARYVSHKIFYVRETKTACETINAMEQQEDKEPSGIV